MKHLYPFCLFQLLLLANMAISAQIPTKPLPNDEGVYLLPSNVIYPKTAAKTIEEENLLFAEKNDLKRDERWINKDSIVYVYDDNDQLLFKIYKRFNNGEWNDSIRHFYEYYSNGNLRFYRQQRINSFFAPTRYFYTYDSNNNVVHIKGEERSFNEWHTSFINIRKYDDNNLMTLSMYDYSSGIFSPDIRYVYENDIFGNRTLKLKQNRVDDDWVDSEQTIYEYDQNDNLILELKQEMYLNAWINDYRFVYEYDSNNNQTMWIDEKWELSSWKNREKRICEYDDNNNVISETSLIGKNDVWLNFLNFRYSYDLNNNLIARFKYHWSGFYWGFIKRTVYEYLENYRVLESVYKQQDNKWVNISRKKYFYTKELSFSDTVLDLHVYPNPSRGQLIIDLGDFAILGGLIEIFNSNGQLVYNQLIDQVSTLLFINLEGFSNGTYYLELSDENTQIKQTLMLVR